jgi:hypothetical protein
MAPAIMQKPGFVPGFFIGQALVAEGFKSILQNLTV